VEKGRIKIGVLGASSCNETIASIAYEVGQEVVRQGAVLICGGLGGVMEAASKGAKAAGGLTVGILPGSSAKDGNPYIDLTIVTDMGQARNIILVQSSDAVIAVSGAYGTLSEIAIALKLGVPCIGIQTWEIDRRIIGVKSPEQAVRLAIDKIRTRGVD